NVALSELPSFRADPGTSLQEHHTGSVELCFSPRYAERAFQDAHIDRKAATAPFVDGTIPTSLDPTLTPKGVHVFSMFTQWVPDDWSKEPHREELEAYADRIIDLYTELAPNFKRAVIDRQVIGPYDMEKELGRQRRARTIRDRRGRSGADAPARSLQLLPLPQPADRRLRRGAGVDHALPGPPGLFLRQQRRRGDRGGDAARQAVHGEERVRRPRAVVPRTHRRHPERHRQLEPQEEGWALSARGRLRRRPLPLPQSQRQ